MPEAAPNQKFYLTTPIYYVNARPHIGHAYTTIVADVLARRHRLLGDDTFFLTGTDEHGQKIERSAAAANIPPQQFADQVSASFQALWDRMGITYNDYIRTTSPRHAAGVQKLWRELESRGHIYLSSYTGAYCVSDEAFVDLPVGTPCPDCGRPLEQVTEENYFFRLSAFQPHLIDLIESNTLVIEPETRRNEVLSFLRGNIFGAAEASGEQLGGNPSVPKLIDIETLARLVEKGVLKLSDAGISYVPGALKDLSISRTGFKWGIQVPDNPKHVIYVWLDALANYITALGYGSNDESLFEKFWLNRGEGSPLHLVGKEIIRFHCVYWPAFLLGLNSRWKQGPTNDPQDGELIVDADAAKLLPKKVQAHGWLLFEESKMSKSRGNIVRTETILDAFGTHYRNELVRLGQPEPTRQDADLFAADVLRYFLLREIPFGNDGSFSFDALITRYNADLANGYGNLVSRTLSVISKSLDGAIPSYSDPTFDVMVVTRVDDDNDPNKLEVLSVGSGVVTEDIATSQEFKEARSRNIKAAMELRRNAIASASESFDSNEISKAVSTTYLLVDTLDKHLTEKAPWKLIKSLEEADQEAVRKIMYSAAETIRIITALLYPILPHTTAKVWSQLGLGDIEQAAKNGDLKNLQWGGLQPGTKLGPLAPIFPRAPKELAQTMTDMENPQKPEPTTAPGAPFTRAESAPVPAAVADARVSGESATESKPEESPTITIDDFAKIDLRAARILVAERIPKADKLLRLEVDLGPLGQRQILSGIALHYTPEELIGRRIVIIANLAPRKMRGLESHGMLLAASEGEDGKPILATFAEDIAPGSRLK